MEKTQNVLPARAIKNAALSQNFQQPLDNARARKPDPVDQPQQHLHVGKHGRGRHRQRGEHHAAEFPFDRFLPSVGNIAWRLSGRRNHLRRLTAHDTGIAGGTGMADDTGIVCDARIVCDTRIVWDTGTVGYRRAIQATSFLSVRWRVHLDWRGEVRWPVATGGIEKFLFSLSLGGSVVVSTASIVALPAMVLTTAEGAVQILPPGVPRMRQKADAAASAAHRAFRQLGTNPQVSLQSQQILLDKRPGAIALVPIRPIRENLLDGDGKKANVSVTILLVCCMISSYLEGLKTSTGRARFFVPPGKLVQQRSAETIHAAQSRSAHSSAQFTQTHCAPYLQRTT